MNANLQKEFEAQMNREWYSAYLYLHMSVYFAGQGLDGMASWMRVQAQEEMAHANHMFDYVLDRCDHVALMDIVAPSASCNSPLEVFRTTLAHEETVTAHINELATLAQKENDHASYQFLQWYINEQVEEESNAKKIVNKLTLIGDNASMLLALDTELGARVFVDPFAGVPA